MRLIRKGNFQKSTNPQQVCVKGNFQKSTNPRQVWYTDFPNSCRDMQIQLDSDFTQKILQNNHNHFFAGLC